MSEGIFPIARSANGSNDPSMTRFQLGTLGQVVKNKPGRCYGVTAYNKAATLYYLMVFDKGSTPVNGNTPRVAKPLLASIGATVTIGPEDFGGFSLGCTLGIGIAISTTPDTLTLAAAQDVNATVTWK